MSKQYESLCLVLLLLFMAYCSHEGEDIPVVLSGVTVYEVTVTTASLEASLASGDVSTISERGFCWSESKTPTVADNVKKSAPTGASFGAIIEGLKPGTRYQVRAYAIHGGGITYSSVSEFTTQDDGVSPGVTFITGITDDGATFSSSLSGQPGEELTEVGFVYGTRVDPTVGGDYKVRVEGASLSVKVGGLLSNANYWVRSYIIVKGELIYGETNAFKTTPSEDDVLQYYVAPGYADDYSNISSWNERHLWNLANVHDPTVVKSGEYYYMYGTDASYGNTHVGHGHFPYRRSKDLVNWEFQGMAMPDSPPAWVKDTLNNMRSRLGLEPINNPLHGYWAPVVRKVGEKYRMYYSIIVDNYILSGKPNTAENFDGSWTERAFIGLMEADDLATNNWVDKGMVVSSSTDRGKKWSRNSIHDWNGYFKWNAIDPSYIVTPEGEHWLVYGSWHSGLVGVQVNPATGKPNQLGEPWDHSNLSTYGALLYTRDINSRWQGSEAPEIIYNPETEYYYLFVAYDELSVAYNTRVLRSKNIQGPYTDYHNRNASNGLNNAHPIVTHPYRFNNHSGWVGISHNAVFDDGNGNWYFASQGRLPAGTGGNAYSNAVMMGHVRKIRWTEDGWPVVMPERYAAVPDVPIKEAELVGNWEVITLKYKYAAMNTSQTLTLTPGHETSGVLPGTWSWDGENKILTIGNQKLMVEREVDWEATPRHHTLVCAGLNANGESIWGKKIK